MRVLIKEYAETNKELREKLKNLTLPEGMFLRVLRDNKFIHAFIAYDNKDNIVAWSCLFHPYETSRYTDSNILHAGVYVESDLRHSGIGKSLLIKAYNTSINTYKKECRWFNRKTGYWAMGNPTKDLDRKNIVAA